MMDDTGGLRELLGNFDIIDSKPVLISIMRFRSGSAGLSEHVSDVIRVAYRIHIMAPVGLGSCCTQLFSWRYMTVAKIGVRWYVLGTRNDTDIPYYRITVPSDHDLELDSERYYHAHAVSFDGVTYLLSEQHMGALKAMFAKSDAQVIEPETLYKLKDD